MAETLFKYAASASATITLNSLASSASLVAGRQSTAIDNTSVKLLDYSLQAHLVMSGTPPTTGGTLEMWVVPLVDDTPTWPGGFGATDANLTVNSRDILGGAGVLVKSVTNDATASRTYDLVCPSVASWFGGIIPQKFVVFIVQSSAQALNAAGNTLVYKGYSTTTA